MLLDVGPHVLDLMDAAAGHIESVAFTGDPRDCLCITTVHAGGAVGQAYISGTVSGYLWDCDVFGPRGILSAPEPDGDEQIRRTIGEEFASVVRSGRAHELDAHRGLYLQRLLQR